ncbi:MAG: ABC transporter substrate-binding protein [Candidatus Lustribacter sp.]|jgi:NitT/TauT family transport system substrate-binding protein
MVSRERFIATTVAAVVAGRSPAFAQQPPALTTLRGTVVPNDDLAPILYAEQSGMFRKAGLDVQLLRSNSGSAVAAAIAGGNSEFGVSSLIALISGHSRGLPFVLIAPSHVIVAGDGTQEMVVLKDSPLRRGSDLNGKVLAVPGIADANWLSSRAFVDADGGDSGSIKFVELPQTAIPAALEQKRVDAAMLQEPVLDRAMAGGAFRSMGDPTQNIAKRWMITAVFMLADFATKNRDAVTRFAGVMRTADDFANTHHAETAPLVAAFNGIDPAVALQMHRNVFAVYLDPREIQPAIDAAARYKLIDHAFPAQELISPFALKPPS